MFAAETKRSLKSTGSRFAFIIGLLIVFIHFFTEILPMKDHIDGKVYPLSAFGQWFGGENATVYSTLFYFIAPILAAFPSAGSYKADMKSGYIKNVLTRTERRTYLCTKYLVAFLSGGMIVVFPMVLDFALTAMVLPALIPQSGTGLFPIFSSSLLGDLYYLHPYAYLISYLGINFLYFGLLASLALPAAHFCDNLFSVVLMPFLVYLFVYAVTQLTGLHQLCPFGFLRPAQPIAGNVVVIAAEVLLMVAAGAVYYAIGVKKDVY
ncbi:hypothetical protein [Marvinbryantia formatexigens]|nr:hypothetical protein [Marvinbryantia formatexigens]UWO26155.1 hypothetical protein NQ534_06730 [Marvinbryantia formatexigens DSM 14469]